MVMDLAPSPQCVGREFVRQYYTLLNNAPTHLHRFYNNNSSFLHGGLDTRDADSAMGQKEIHNKIQALNFRDCHAKIHQVDSQSTLGNGVVVQVSGELSNNGQPMRRFTQTFVLAAQAPKKYFVHNDIFRYQDFGFEEEEEDLEEHPMSEVCDREPEMDSVRQEVVEVEEPPQQQPAKIANVDLIQTQPQIPSINQQQIYYSMQQMQQTGGILPMMQQVTINGSVHEDSSIIAQQPGTQQTIQQSYIPEPAVPEQTSIPPEVEHEAYMQPQPTPQQQQMQAESVVSEEEVNEMHQQQEQVQHEFAPTAPEPEPELQAQVQNSGPKTYANLVKSYPSTTMSTGVTSPQPPMQNMRIDERPNSHPIQNQQHISQPGVPPNQQMHRVGSGLSQQNQQYQRMPRTGGPMRVDNERRVRSSNYSDAHQLFLGNLPHQATESELRTIFERYGRVADLRVHSKNNDRIKGPQGTVGARVPNYGFITFEDSSVVQKVLNDCPIFYPDENGQKLNVEEKKIRPREVGSGGGRPNNMDNVNMRSMPMQQQQRSGGGPGGPGIMRGGQHGGRGRGGFSRGGDGGRGGMIRQSAGQTNSQNYQNRR